ncbi:hypothetical protein HAZT_HAZT004366 [Hyalella azteca]|uniref:Diacylglycerol kinase iota-like domain-containing protein n=1 Tax=Hyalella azteca TaxID=294128 RepID=A0A6A0H1L3_HYAAZ|nr:hypothetical protein HAZT_HAZT004366 [Hyalella azteca]
MTHPPQVRRIINKKISDAGAPPLAEHWCFLDCNEIIIPFVACTAERFFRIDHGQEHLHFVTDVCSDELFLLNPDDDVPPASSSEGDVIPTQSVGDVAPQPSSDSPLSPSANCRLAADVVAGDVSNLLERHTENLIKAAKLGDLKAVSIETTALHHAARLGHRDVVRYLVAAAPPALLDLTDTERGQSALHLAAANGRRNVCCMLVAAGASLFLKDTDGHTPLSLARRADDQELAQYLESKCITQAWARGNHRAPSSSDAGRNMCNVERDGSGISTGELPVIPYEGDDGERRKGDDWENRKLFIISNSSGKLSIVSDI